MKQVSTFALLLMLGTGTAFADPAREMIRLEAGEERVVQGSNVRASTPSLALVSLSSEFATIAVIDGALSLGEQSAKSGEALVTTIDSGTTQKLRFDARRLAVSLPPQWLADAQAPLDAIAARQKRQRFWGLIEPAGINASAPVSPEMETVRASYLVNPAITALRQEAKGEPVKLAALTAKRFATALAARDTKTVAALIDPKPFTDTGADADAWQKAREGFAAQIADDAMLAAAMSAEPVAVADDQTAFDAGGYRIRLVPRDRALFVQSVEKL